MVAHSFDTGFGNEKGDFQVCLFRCGKSLEKIESMKRKWKLFVENSITRRYCLSTVAAKGVGDKARLLNTVYCYYLGILNKYL